MFSTIRNNLFLRICIALAAVLPLFFIWTVLATAPDLQDVFTAAAWWWAIVPLLLAAAGMWIPGRARWFGFGLFVAAFALKLAVALWTDAEPFSDFLTMYRAAEDLSRGGFDKTQAYWPYLLRWAYQTFFVAYEALILWLFPFGRASLLVANALFMAGANVLLYALARMALPERNARFAALLYLFFLAPFFLAPVLTNQHVSLFFVLLGLYLLARGGKTWCFVAAGFFLAVGNALRPDALLLVLALLGALALHLIDYIRAHSFHWKQLAREAKPVFLAAATCWLAGVLLSGASAVTGLNPNGLRNMNPEWKFVIGLNMETGGGFSRTLYDQVFPTAADDPNDFIYPLETSRAVAKDIVRGHMRRSKSAMADFLYQKTVRAWGFTESTSWAFQGMDERVTPLGEMTVEDAAAILRPAERIYFAVICALAAVGIVMLCWQKDVPALLIVCGLTIVLFFGVHVLIEVQTRYKYFVMPFLFVLAGGVPSFIRRKGR